MNMKKFLMVVGILLLGKVVHAGVPIDQAGQNNQGPYWNTTLWSSSAPASGTQASISFPAITKVSGSTSYNGRNCLTKIILQLNTGSTFYVVDGGLTSSATNYVVYGIGLGSSGTNTLQINEDHLGPLCGTAGNAMSLIIPAPSVNTSNNAISAEGYTFFPYSANNGQ